MSEEDKKIEVVEEAVNHPKHYTSGAAKCSNCGTPIECIDVVEHLNFNLGNCVKYIWRAGLKGKLLEDLKKSQFYITREILRLTKDK